MRKYIVIGVIVVVGIILYNFFVGTYNSLVQKEVEIEGKWANVEAQYQRRADLFKNLVATVKGYADHEQQTLIGVIEQRAQTTQVQLNVDELTAENLEKFQAAQAELGQGLGRLLAIGESYPDLKASQNFIALQDEIAGTENRVTKARTDFNDAVKDLNSYCRTFPRNMLAGMYGFEGNKAYFEAAEGTEATPEVAF